MCNVQLAATQPCLVLWTVSFVQRVNTLLPWAAAQSAATAQLATTPIPLAGARACNVQLAATHPSLVLPAVSFVQLAPTLLQLWQHLPA